MANIKLKGKKGSFVNKQQAMYLYSQGMAIPLIACKLKTQIIAIQNIIKKCN